MWNVRGLLRQRRQFAAAGLRSDGVNPEDIRLRTATAADYDQIIAVVDDWWGRPIGQALPRVFLDHFRRSGSQPVGRCHATGSGGCPSCARPSAPGGWAWRY